MNKRWAVAGAVATIVSVGAGTTAGADPKGEPEVWDCPGGTTMIITAGRNGWIDGVKYQAVQFTIDSPEFSAVKVWGGGKDLANPDAITCTQTFPGGTATVTAVPA
jgi:hypothetical protein